MEEERKVRYDEFNQGLPRKNPAACMVRAGLELSGTSAFKCGAPTTFYNLKVHSQKVGQKMMFGIIY